MNNHPITPPPELVERLRTNAPHGIRDAGQTRERHLINAAYAAGADQELEACCHLLRQQGFDVVDDLRATRRPKPPSLKEQALQALKEAAEMADYGPPEGITTDQVDIIRRALECIR